MVGVFRRSYSIKSQTGNSRLKLVKLKAFKILQRNLNNDTNEDVYVDSNKFAKNAFTKWQSNNWSVIFDWKVVYLYEYYFRLSVTNYIVLFDQIKLVMFLNLE